MPRVKRKLSPTHIYHVINRGNNKSNIFLDKADKYIYRDILSKKKEKFGFEIYGYCLMDNHIHLVINEDNSLISDIMKSINISYVGYFNKKYDRVGHLFQGRFKSEIVDSDRYLLTLIRYIHNNPVKARMVNKLEDYLWSSYNSYLKYKTDYLINTNYILDIISNNKIEAIKSFIKFSNEENDDECLDICKDKEIQNKEQALNYINQLIEKDNIDIKELRNNNKKIKGTMTHKLILDLKQNSSLALKDIGEIFNVSKSTIHRLLKNA